MPRGVPPLAEGLTGYNGKFRSASGTGAAIAILLLALVPLLPRVSVVGLVIIGMLSVQCGFGLQKSEFAGDYTDTVAPDVRKVRHRGGPDASVSAMTRPPDHGHNVQRN